MPQAGLYIFASLLSGVSAALVLASGPSYAHARYPQGVPHNDKREQSAYECQASSCQIAHLNSVEDFCLWAPSHPEPRPSVTRDTEHTLTAWCMKSTLGARLILDGTISWACFVKTPGYVQISGVGNLTNINVPTDGVASASGEGDRVPGLVFTSAYNQLERIYDWTSFVSQERFCFRACNPSTDGSTACPPIFDASGCTENVPVNRDVGLLEDCVGNVMETPSTLYQQVLAVPSHHSACPPAGCTTHGMVRNPRAARMRRAIVSTTGSESASSALVTSSSSSSSRSHRHSAPLASSLATTATDTNATTITFPPLPAPTPNATTLLNSTTPALLPAPTSLLHSFNRSHSHPFWHSHSNRHSHHHSPTSSAPVSSSASFSFSHHSFTSWQPSSSTVFSLSDPPSTFSALSPPSSTFATSTFSSPDPPPLMVSTTSSATTSMPTSSFPSSTSSSLSEFPHPPSHHPAPSSSPTSSTPSTTSLSTSTTTSPTTSSTSSTSSQTSSILAFSTSTFPSSVPATSPSMSSSAVPNSATQLSSQCPPVSHAVVNAGPITFSTLLPLTCAILTIVLSSSIGIFIL